MSLIVLACVRPHELDGAVTGVSEGETGRQWSASPPNAEVWDSSSGCRTLLFIFGLFFLRSLPCWIIFNLFATNMSCGVTLVLMLHMLFAPWRQRKKKNKHEACRQTGNTTWHLRAASTANSWRNLVSPGQTKLLLKWGLMKHSLNIKKQHVQWENKRPRSLRTLDLCVSASDGAFSVICVLYGCSLHGDQSPHKGLYLAIGLHYEECIH